METELRGATRGKKDKSWEGGVGQKNNGNLKHHRKLLQLQIFGGLDRRNAAQRDCLH